MKTNNDKPNKKWPIELIPPTFLSWPPPTHAL